VNVDPQQSRQSRVNLQGLRLPSWRRHFRRGFNYEPFLLLTTREPTRLTVGRGNAEVLPSSFRSRTDVEHMPKDDFFKLGTFRMIDQTIASFYTCRDPSRATENRTPGYFSPPRTALDSV
jgi:hypothetical protein